MASLSGAENKERNSSLTSSSKLWDARDPLAAAA